MEYLIASEKFKNSKNFGTLFYQGRFDIYHNQISVLEGDTIYKTKPEINALPDYKIINNTIIGNFNYFRYNKETENIIIKNDKFGTLPIYVFHNEKKIIISNNVWRIVNLLNEKELSINKKYVKFSFASWGTDLDGKTLFNNIIELNPATNLICNTKNLSKLKISTYYTLIQQTDSKLTLKQAVEIFDNDLEFTFSRIKEKNPKMILGFGNSGGLDSRLIPIYAKQHNINIQGLTTLNKFPKKIFKSITYKNAQKIAKLYNFNNKFINYKFTNYETRQLLDIKNNPFGTSEIFKNPYDKLPMFDYYVTGGNGFIVGGGWKKIVNINKKSDFLDAFINYNNKFNVFNWTKNGHLFFKNIFDKEYIEYVKNQKIRFYEKHSEKDNFSIIRSYHQYSLNKRSPSGGFESVNRLFKTYNIYYPIVFENTLLWDESFFFNRSVLKSLIQKKSLALYNIPSQNYSKLNNEPLTLIDKLNRRFALKYRTWGLDYENWVSDRSFLLYSDRILKRKNPLFFELLDISEEKFFQFNLFKDVHAHISLDILKLKKIIDMYYYKEFSLINNDKFIIK